MGQIKKKVTPKRKKGALHLRVNKEFVRKRREELGMSTDTQLAERCGMTRQNLWRTLNYEGANLENANLGSFVYLAEALECKIDDLVISSPTDNTARRKKSASKVAGVASCIAAVAASWFVSATWYTLDRSVVDWALVFTSSSALWFVVFGVLSRQWFLLTNLGTQATSVLFLLPGRPDIGAAHWMMGALLVGIVCYSVRLLSNREKITRSLEFWGFVMALVTGGTGIYFAKQAQRTADASIHLTTEALAQQQRHAELSIAPRVHRW